MFYQTVITSKFDPFGIQDGILDFSNVYKQEEKEIERLKKLVEDGHKDPNINVFL